MAMNGICLVISPLIALMKDQVSGLRKKNITAFAIFSGMSRQEVENALRTSINSNCKFLFVSPERLETAKFLEFLPAMKINMIAVDEAHCISQWGYDFRPPYLRIAALREELPNVPVLALTASATQEVQDDICAKLDFKDQKIFRSSFERPNLSYSVFRVDSRINKIVDILSKVKGTALVYCKSRKRTKEIAELLQLHDISADFYHAGLSQEERNRKQEDWIENRVRVIACTNAFGMGIDKPDVRVVIHADVPDCLENYYQEAGRAGRDRKKAYAALLYDEKELEELSAQTDIRFPPFEEIRKMYSAVVNFLQIPPGSGQGEYYDFNIGDFLQKFQLSAFSAGFGLKSLEQEGWLSFNEQVFLPSRVRFTANRDYLFQYEEKYPADDPIIKCLLRTYEGIFDFAVPVSELLIAKIAGRHIDDITSTLNRLHKQGIIAYEPQKDTPQIYMLRDRIRIEEFYIDKIEHNKRKERYANRIDRMIAYIHEGSECRSKIIGNYFGDANLLDCGICDNCLKRKKRIFTKEEFEIINNRLHEHISGKGLHTKDLLEKLSGLNKEKVWSVIEYLQAEKKIELDKKGWLRLPS
jgi:ATP-dependent DNA helicase RecQ